MATSNKPSAEQEQIILQGFKDNLSRNEIARRAKVSGALVSRRAKAAGHSFGREMTAAATAAASVDAAARRAALRDRALDLAEKLYDQALSDQHYQIVRTREGDQIVPRDTPTAKDAADLSRAILAAVQADAKLGEADRNADSSPILAALSRLVATPDKLPGE